MSFASELGAILDPKEIAATLSPRMDKVDAYLGRGWTARNTARLRRSLAAAVAGTGYSDHLVIGDSHSAIWNAQYGASSQGTVWPGVLAARLNSTVGVPSGGTGWVRPAENTYDSRISDTGSWSRGGSGGGTGSYAFTSSSGATLTFTSDVAGTQVSVAYLDTSGAFTVTIDGGAPVTVTPTGAGTLGTHAVTGLSNATHTVTVTTTTTTTTYIVAFLVSQTSGLRVHNFAIAGGGAGLNAFTGANYGGSGFAARNLMPDPDVVHIAGLFADAFYNRSVADFKADLVTLIGYWPDSDKIIHIGFQGNSGTSGTAYPALAAAAREVADTYGLPVIDVYDSVGGFTAANAAGYMNGNLYPSATGLTKWADLAFTPIGQDLATTYDYLGTGKSQTLLTPALGTPVSGNLANCTIPGTGAWVPKHYNWKAWTYDPVAIYGGGAVSAGFLYVAAIHIADTTPISNIILHLTAGDGGLTSGRNFAALYQGGSLLAATADQTTAWATSGTKVMALTAPVTPSVGLAYVAWYANGNTALRFGNGVGAISAHNTGPALRYAYLNPGGLTTAPPATINSANLVANHSTFWAAVS
jgi:hypothetical protein